MAFDLFHWLKKPTVQPHNGAIDTLFLFLRSLINREDLIEDIWHRYQTVDSLPEGEREWLLISTYLALEEFLVTHKSPVVKKEFTKTNLRVAVSESLSVSELPGPLKLLFMSPKEERLLLFHIIIHDILEKIAHSSGDARVSEIVTRVTQETPLSGLVVTVSGIDSAKVKRDVSTEELTVVCASLFRAMYDDLASSIGQNSAEEAVRVAYKFIEKTYGVEKLQEFFEFVPDNLLSAERISYLSREELARRVQSATVEEKKKEEAEKLAEQLTEKVTELEHQYEATEETKRAMLNLLEDARELEATLKIERDRATAIVSSMREGLYVVDAQYRAIVVNNVAETLFGLETGSSIGKKLSDITVIYKGDRRLPEEERPLFQTMKTGEAITASMDDNYYIESPNGKIPIVLSTAPLKRDGEIIGGLVTFHDVTKDKEIKNTIEHTVEERTRELKHEQAKLTGSINSLVAGFIIAGPDGAIITKNPASEVILGITHAVTNLDDMEKELGGIVKLTEHHEKGREEKKPIKIKDILLGTKHLELYFSPIFLTSGGEFIGTVILIQDVTEAKVMERSREEFFSIASHELRTPLTAIRGNTSMILDYFAEQLKDEQLKEMITDVHESSIRLINIVNDFLQTSRLEQGRLSFKNEAFDVAVLIADVLKEYDVTGSRKKLYLKYVPPDKPLPQAYADKDRVKEVLINLVGNALKFTEEGGVTVKVYLSEDYIRVVVEDTGRGIPYENQMLLFRKFQQAGNSLFTRDTTKGTGLGLYISKLMVEGMGGTIGLQYSRPGVGSAFGFALPVVGSKHAMITPEVVPVENKSDQINPSVAQTA